MQALGQLLAIDNPVDLRFGVAPRPLKTRRGMTIGGGIVYPELNFTLPEIDIVAANMPAIEGQYRQMITSALDRAVELEAPGLVIEFETLPPMTQTPAWGIAITRILADAMEDTWAKHKMPSVLRATPNDTREFERPPLMRSGHYWDEMLETFDGCAKAGAELLSIESVGGKELHDEALQQCDLAMVVFSLCVLGARDMHFLWTNLHRVADRYEGVNCAGDTACGFGNTAMVLADQKMIPRVFAAVVRAISAVRSLVAFECGSVGPGKDCGYENPIIKAITGFPMAMEGKSAACAHFSVLGNLAAAACDTWSNESVANVKLLSGMAPTVSLEQLVYDCRLMNESLKDGRDKAIMLRNWLVRSDAGRDPQAYVLTPESCVTIARAIVGAKDHYRAGVAAGLAAIGLIEEGMSSDCLHIAPREVPWVSMMREQLESLPATVDEFIARQTPLVMAATCRLADYGVN
jgi:methanol---5-hydroxybenzimidazolylcobamide Co-methyltransferase